MIKAIIKGIFKVIISLTSLLVAPLDNLIQTFLPDLGNAINSVGQFFNFALNTLGFCVSMLGLSSLAINLIILYFTFKLTAPLAVYTFKVAIKWYNALKI